ncbi:unnamed protein product [Mycetohabitans rhizoxinica HKI 454]|uniref:Uncharacterized protein n=1 Tax=Mycetohabitans rhizoxinica (strain DSM 19002 / CIP 109453 / HKI 454) TaxID=882378 RepID=E5APN0_MYCRK|nr:unnamed protein product [Mycetohabitans rhizoxinica HKI 454]
MVGLSWPVRVWVAVIRAAGFTDCDGGFRLPSLLF